MKDMKKVSFNFNNNFKIYYLIININFILINLGPTYIKSEVENIEKFQINKVMNKSIKNFKSKSLEKVIKLNDINKFKIDFHEI